MKINLNIEPILTELPIHERIKPAVEAGFTAIEFWMADQSKINALLKIKQTVKVDFVSFVANGPTGEPGGCPIKKEDREKYLTAIQTTAQLAKSVGARQLITCTGNLLKDRSRESQRATLIEALREAGKMAEKLGVTLMLEPLNTRKDHAGYFLDSIDEGAEIVRTVNSPAVKLLFDIYHTQIMDGDIIARIQEHKDVIGHFHAAGVPGRHELFIGELNYPAILEAINAINYQGYFALEYFPKLASRESLEKTWNMLKPFVG